MLVHFESHNRQRSLRISILQALKAFIKALLTLTEIYISHIHVLIKVDAISRFLFQQLTIIITIAKMIMLWNIFEFHARFTSHFSSLILFQGSKCSGGYPGKSFQVALQRIGISEMNIKLLIFNPLRTENRSLVRQRLNLIKIQYLPILVCNKSKILETGTHCQKTLLEIIIHQGIHYLHFFLGNSEEHRVWKG